MVIPRRIPGLKIAVVALFLFGVLWISLEGDLRLSALIALMSVVAAVGFMIQRVFGGKTLNRFQAVGVFAAAGLAAGLIFTPLTLIYMALKTGLHGHGPEFSQSEILWIVDRALLWALTGLMAALGFLLLLMGAGQRKRE